VRVIHSFIIDFGGVTRILIHSTQLEFLTIA
jgi:hypothetical protein